MASLPACLSAFTIVEFHLRLVLILIGFFSTLASQYSIQKPAIVFPVSFSLPSSLHSTMLLIIHSIPRILTVSRSNSTRSYLLQLFPFSAHLIGFWRFMQWLIWFQNHRSFISSTVVASLYRLRSRLYSSSSLLFPIVECSFSPSIRIPG